MNTIVRSKNLSIGDWIITYILTAIPLIGLIMLFVWAFGGGTQPNKRNWAKAMLIIYSIVIVLIIIAIILIGAAFGAIIMGILGMANPPNGL